MHNFRHQNLSVEKKSNKFSSTINSCKNPGFALSVLYGGCSPKPLEINMLFGLIETLIL